MSLLGTVACISLEPWDETWRRNQHLAAQLVRRDLAERVLFVEPPRPGSAPRRFRPMRGIDVRRPVLPAPKRLGGLALAGAALRLGPLRAVDAVWVNDPTLGRYCVGDRPAVYDVTDDWRTFDDPGYVRRRIVAAEDELARTARTVVCSRELALRWERRYGHSPPIVHNGVDVEAYVDPLPVTLPGAGPHAGYVGTLHSERVDLDLVVELAGSGAVGTVHLVGPDALTAPERARLSRASGVRLHPPVPSAQVPGWMVAMDVLVAPHVVSDFTLSLDAIKAYEYAAAGRPVVATPTSGFPLAPGATVVARDGFVEAVRVALGATPPLAVPGVDHSWASRAEQFAAELRAA